MKFKLYQKAQIERIYVNGMTSIQAYIERKIPDEFCARDWHIFMQDNNPVGMVKSDLPRVIELRRQVESSLADWLHLLNTDDLSDITFDAMREQCQRLGDPLPQGMRTRTKGPFAAYAGTSRKKKRTRTANQSLG